MIKRLIALTLVVALWSAQLAAAAPQAITRDDQKDLMVTIYNGNLGLVKDTREVRLDAGMLEVQFADVAAQIDPTSVHLKSLTDPTGLKILEQNYEYDLLTSAKLMEKYVGKKVRLYQSNGSYQEATLLIDQRARLRDQRADPHGPLRAGRPAGAAREPGLQADARLAPAERQGGGPARRGVLSHRGHHLEGRLRHGHQRRRHARAT